MEWDSTVEVLVVGSGNGALTTALCSHEMGAKNVLIIEKGEKFGGLSCRGGGGVWIPCNHLAMAAGAQDSIEEAKLYLTQTLPADTNWDKVDAYLKAGPEMMRLLHDKCNSDYLSISMYPDYYTAKPGAKLGHRALDPAAFYLDELGEEAEHLMPTHPQIFINNTISMTLHDVHELESKMFSPRAVKLLLNYLTDFPWRLKTKRDRRIGCGSAGVARLRLETLRRDIPLWRNTTLVDLIFEGERVVGALIEREGQPMRIRATRGVMMAMGGFGRSQAMRDKYLPKPTDYRWSPDVETCEGDAINIGLKHGAALGRMNGAWWCTTFVVPGESIPQLAIAEKCKPGAFVVNKKGQRIANESENYMAYMLHAFEAHAKGIPASPLYMVFDATFRKKYIVGPLLTSVVKPDFTLPKAYYDEGFLAKANTIPELARQIGIDEAGLTETLARMNEYARNGKDPEFLRGDDPYDHYYGDEAVKPNPCLGPIEKPPFYAIRLDLGDFGTHGGVVTDHLGRVCKESGEPIPGLYGTGNCTNALLSTYPGPGSTLGPAMVFGYLAAKHMTNA